MVRIFFLILLNLIAAGYTNAQTAETFFKKELESLAKDHISVFYTECSLPDDISRSDGKLLIYFPLGSKTGALEEFSWPSQEKPGKDASWSNSGDIAITDGLSLGELAVGGIGGRAWRSQIIHFLSKRPFIMLNYGELDLMLTSQPMVACPSFH
ncbi:MAG TPA: hypothetical protein VHL08_06215 [Dongiaceae bacterium]|jgi:hypothetical protein|nr:hypothetical protein [Dongiaceae bacterium]